MIAGIVLYNPKIERLKENIDAVSRQVDNVYCIDNDSKNKSEIDELLGRYSNVSIIYNNENKGIAFALNQLLSIAIDGEIDYLLTLDQDSVIGKEYIRRIMDFRIDNDIALIAPNILDINDKEGLLLEKSGIRPVSDCITSGTVMNIAVCKKIGWFDEKMFIDYVDFEYCYRVIDSGYKIIRNNNVILSHQLGDGKVIKLFGKKSLVANHNPIRHYYLTRNLVYLMIKYPKRSINFIKRIIKEFVFIILYEIDKIAKLKACMKGIYEGWHKR